MNTISTPPAPTAEALAANFQVSELEPRLENAWPGGQLDQGPEPSEPGC